MAFFIPYSTSRVSTPLKKRLALHGFEFSYTLLIYWLKYRQMPWMKLI